MFQSLLFGVNSQSWSLRAQRHSSPATPETIPIASSEDDDESNGTTGFAGLLGLSQKEEAIMRGLSSSRKQRIANRLAAMRSEIIAMIRQEANDQSVAENKEAGPAQNVDKAQETSVSSVPSRAPSRAASPAMPPDVAIIPEMAESSAGASKPIIILPSIASAALTHSAAPPKAPSETDPALDILKAGHDSLLSTHTSHMDALQADQNMAGIVGGTPCSQDPHAVVNNPSAQIPTSGLQSLMQHISAMVHVSSAAEVVQDLSRSAPHLPAGPNHVRAYMGLAAFQYLKDGGRMNWSLGSQESMATVMEIWQDYAEPVFDSRDVQ
jgi:hypothetical protein